MVSACMVVMIPCKVRTVFTKTNRQWQMAWIVGHGWKRRKGERLENQRWRCPGKRHAVEPMGDRTTYEKLSIAVQWPLETIHCINEWNHQVNRMTPPVDVSQTLSFATQCSSNEVINRVTILAEMDDIDGPQNMSSLTLKHLAIASKRIQCWSPNRVTSFKEIKFEDSSRYFIDALWQFKFPLILSFHNECVLNSVHCFFLIYCNHIDFLFSLLIW